MNKDAWNRCDECGEFIAYQDFANGTAIHIMLEPDSDLGVEKWETLCAKHSGIPPMKIIEIDHVFTKLDDQLQQQSYCSINYTGDAMNSIKDKSEPEHIARIRVFKFFYDRCHPHERYATVEGMDAMKLYEDYNRLVECNNILRQTLQDIQDDNDSSAFILRGKARGGLTDGLIRLAEINELQSTEE